MDEREIFERHAERVLQYFVNKVQRPADASDLAQETFARAFERLRRGDVRSPRAFLFGVANLVLREYWTAQNRRRDHRVDTADLGSLSVVEMGAAKTSVTSMVARKQGHQRMLDAMRRLRLDYQNVLELRYWHDLQYGEIAEVLGQNAKTVGVWLTRAKVDLRRILESDVGPRKADDDEPFVPQGLDRWLRDAGEAVSSHVTTDGREPGS